MYLPWVSAALYHLAEYPWRRVQHCKRAWRSGSSDLDANVTTDRILFQSQVARAVILFALSTAPPPPRPSASLWIARVQVPASFGEHGPFALEASHSLGSSRSFPQILLLLPPGTYAVRTSGISESSCSPPRQYLPHSSMSFLIQFPDQRQLAYWTMPP